MDGTVKWFRDDKGFGFITDENGKDFYVHFSAIQSHGYKTLKEGDLVTFEAAEMANGPVALTVSPKITTEYKPIEETIALEKQLNCKEIVENHWRSSLTFAAAGSPLLALQCVSRFDEKIQEIAITLPEHEAKQFLANIERERNLIFDEYTLNPTQLKNRLGVTQTRPQPTGCLGVVLLFAVVPLLYVVGHHLS